MFLFCLFVFFHLYKKQLCLQRHSETKAKPFSPLLLPFRVLFLLVLEGSTDNRQELPCPSHPEVCANLIIRSVPLERLQSSVHPSLCGYACVCVCVCTRARIHVPSLAPLSFILRDFLQRPTGSSTSSSPCTRAFNPPPPLRGHQKWSTKVAAVSLYPEILQVHI